MYYVAGAPHSMDKGQVIFFKEMNSGNMLSYEPNQVCLFLLADRTHFATLIIRFYKTSFITTDEWLQ